VSPLITFEIEDRSLSVKLRTAKEGVPSGLSKGIYAATISTASHIKRDLLSGQLVNRRSGNLSRAIYTKMESPFVGVIYVGKEAPYGRWINDGSAPHIIRAVHAQALHFVVNGADIFRKSVRHPGTKATHFMEEGLSSWKPEIIRIVTRHVTAGLKGQNAGE
jgi:hypothetical protein